MKKIATLAMIGAAAGVNVGEILDDAIRRSHNGHSKYKPHQGSKEQQRRLKRMQK